MLEKRCKMETWTAQSALGYGCETVRRIGITAIGKVGRYRFIVASFREFSISQCPTLPAILAELPNGLVRRVNDTP